MNLPATWNLSFTEKSLIYAWLSQIEPSIKNLPLFSASDRNRTMVSNLGSVEISRRKSKALQWSPVHQLQLSTFILRNWFTNIACWQYSEKCTQQTLRPLVGRPPILCTDVKNAHFEHYSVFEHYYAQPYTPYVPYTLWPRKQDCSLTIKEDRRCT